MKNCDDDLSFFIGLANGLIIGVIIWGLIWAGWFYLPVTEPRTILTVTIFFMALIPALIFWPEERERHKDYQRRSRSNARTEADKQNRYIHRVDRR